MAPDTPTQAAVKINGTTLSPRSAEIIKYTVQNARETTAETVSWATDGVSLGKNFVPASKSTAETEHDRAEAEYGVCDISFPFPHDLDESFSEGVSRNGKKEEEKDEHNADVEHYSEKFAEVSSYFPEQGLCVKLRVIGLADGVAGREHHCGERRRRREYAYDVRGAELFFLYGGDEDRHYDADEQRCRGALLGGEGCKEGEHGKIPRAALLIGEA